MNEKVGIEMNHRASAPGILHRFRPRFRLVRIERESHLQRVKSAQPWIIRSCRCRQLLGLPAQKIRHALIEIRQRRKALLHIRWQFDGDAHAAD